MTTDADRIHQHGSAIGDLTDHLCAAGYGLGLWAAQDDSRPDPAARLAANAAMDEIDVMLRELHALRSRLLDEIRDADDTTAARVDALLAARGA
jgi:hypothetical protein